VANPVSKAIVKAGTERNTQGSSRLESALAAFAQKKQADTFSDRLYEWLIGIILSAGCKAFGANVNALREYLGEPIVRRGVASVLSGIATYGITKPQLLRAPFLVVWNLTDMCNLKCRHCYQRAGVPAPDAECIYNQNSWNQLLVDFKRADNVRELAFAPTIRRR